MRVIVCGGRDYADRDQVEATLAVELEIAGAGADDPVTIVHGDSRGADRLAGSVAEAWGYPVEKHPADWKAYGKGAGPIRNRHMLACGADLVIAFPGGSGTADMVSIAKWAGVPVVEVPA